MIRRLATCFWILLALPGTALAAPPANDNRADAEAIPAFPHTLTATTAEATVERLDPRFHAAGGSSRRSGTGSTRRLTA